MVRCPECDARDYARYGFTLVDGEYYYTKIEEVSKIIKDVYHAANINYSDLAKEKINDLKDNNLDKSKNDGVVYRSYMNCRHCF